MRSSVEVVSLLLEHKANPHQKHESEWDALCYAAMGNNVSVGKFLIQHKANIEKEDDDGEASRRY